MSTVQDRNAVTRLLRIAGEDPSREGLQKTPHRFMEAWKEYTRGYSMDPAALLKTFEDGATNYDEFVIVRDIPVYSLCEHHLAPFFGKAHIGYIPAGRVVGLSKLPRLVDAYARRLQVQERLTTQIAHTIHETLKPRGTAVVLELRHTCMEMRGIKAIGSSTLTSCMLGDCRDEPSARAEFLRLIKE